MCPQRVPVLHFQKLTCPRVLCPCLSSFFFIDFDDKYRSHARITEHGQDQYLRLFPPVQEMDWLSLPSNTCVRWWKLLSNILLESNSMVQDIRWQPKKHKHGYKYDKIWRYVNFYKTKIWICWRYVISLMDIYDDIVQLIVIMLILS